MTPLGYPAIAQSRRDPSAMVLQEPLHKLQQLISRVVAELVAKILPGLPTSSEGWVGPALLGPCHKGQLPHFLSLFLNRKENYLSKELPFE